MCHYHILTVLASYNWSELKMKNSHKMNLELIWNMFVIIKKGEIVKSKWYKTNQGPQLVLIYYKLIYFYEENFSDANCRRSTRLISQSDVPKTVCANFALSWLFYRFQSSDVKGTKERRPEVTISTVLNLNVNGRIFIKRRAQLLCQKNKRTFSTLSLSNRCECPETCKLHSAKVDKLHCISIR